MSERGARRLAAAAGTSPLWRVWGLVAGLVFIAAVGPLVWRYLVALTPDQRLVDLDVYRAAGESILIGRPVYTYLTPPPQLLPFTYPPFAALLAVPLALLPWGLVGSGWTLGQLALLVAATAIAFRPLLARVPRARLPLTLAALAAALAWLLPVRDGIKFGQVDILLLALVAADLLPARTRWPRGLLVGLATAVKLTPGVFVIGLWVEGRRRAAVTAAATAAAATAAAALADPTSSHAFWAGAVFESGRLGVNSGTSNQSLRGMLMRTPLPDSVRTLVWLALVALVAYAGYRRIAAAGRAGDRLGAAALGGLLAVLLSPVAWIHHLTWAALALAAIVRDGRDRRRLLAALAVAACLVLPVPWWGADLLVTDTGPPVFGRLVQDAFGLAALTLLFTVPIGREPRPRAPAVAVPATPRELTVRGPQRVPPRPPRQAPP